MNGPYKRLSTIPLARLRRVIHLKSSPTRGHVPTTTLGAGTFLTFNYIGLIGSVLGSAVCTIPARKFSGLFGMRSCWGFGITRKS